MKTPFLVGPRLYLRPLEESDVTEDYVAWLNQEDITRFLETGKFPTTPERVREFVRHFTGSTTDIGLAVILKEGDQHVGNVTLSRINWIHRNAETGLMLGRKDSWGQGYGGEALSLLLDYAFERLGLRKIIGHAVADNQTSIAMVQRLGFRIEGTLREHYFVAGTFHDGVILGLFQHEFQKQD